MSPGKEKTKSQQRESGDGEEISPGRRARAGAELGKRKTRCHSPSSRILSALLSEIPLIVISCFLGVNATLSTVLDGTSFVGREGQRDVLLWRRSGGGEHGGRWRTRRGKGRTRDLLPGAFCSRPERCRSPVGRQHKSKSACAAARRWIGVGGSRIGRGGGGTHGEPGDEEWAEDLVVSLFYLALEELLGVGMVR